MRGRYHRELTSIEGNAVKAIRRRAEIQNLIIPLSAEIERLYEAKEKFYNESIVPTENILTMPDKPKQPTTDRAALMLERNNIRCWLTKNKRNVTLFTGPKQADLLQRISEKTARRTELDTLLKNDTNG